MTDFAERPAPSVVIGREPAAVLALPVLCETPNGSPEPADPQTGAVLDSLGLNLPTIAADARFTASPGSVLAFPVAEGSGSHLLDGVRRVALLGFGDGTGTAVRRAGAGLARWACGVDRLRVRLPSAGPTFDLRAFVEGLLIAAHQPVAVGARERTSPVGTVYLDGLLDGDDGSADVAGGYVERACSTARAVWLARDLAGVPSSVKNPPWLAQVSVELAQASGLEVTVLDEHDLRSGGFGGLLAVGGGSPSPPRLVTVAWPGTGDQRHVVLVGKGITFDTGGLSIKSSDAMTSMRTDMTGAAAALAAVLAAARERLPVAVTAVLAIAENSVGEGSYRPGDVLTIWGGRTVEIANTDAEGRVVLADALGWACATLAPDVIIDLATLTGAATLGLGRGHAALFTTDDDVAAQLTTAGVDSGERVWRLPLVEDYATVVKSTIAGLAHIAPDGRFGGGGAIAAALFLREVVAPQAAAGPAWAHLDIAGPARSEAVSHEIGKGPTGFGARLLVRWLQQMSAGR